MRWLDCPTPGCTNGLWPGQDQCFTCKYPTEGKNTMSDDPNFSEAAYRARALDQAQSLAGLHNETNTDAVLARAKAYADFVLGK